MSKSKEIKEDYLRSVVFGVEDALVSTTGVVVGINAGSHDKSFVILSGIVTVAVEAVSMAAGQYLSQKAVNEMNSRGRKGESVFITALLMFISYALAGALPVIPFLFSSSVPQVVYSVLFAIVGLFLLGYFKAQYLKIPPKRSGFEMVFVGGAAAAIGLIVGNLMKI